MLTQRCINTLIRDSIYKLKQINFSDEKIIETIMIDFEIDEETAAQALKRYPNI